MTIDIALQYDTWQQLSCSTPHRFIVIGNPIAHSKSPTLHQIFAKSIHMDIHYHRQFCPNNPDSFVAVVASFFAGGGTGANVTVPFKEMAFELCAQVGRLSDFAQAAGAVNTLALHQGKLYGDNTDGRGLVNDLKAQGVDLSNKKILMVGAGGAARGAILPLLDAGIQSLHIANRTPAKALALIDSAAQWRDVTQCTHSDLPSTQGHFDVIINATSTSLGNDALDFNDTLSADFAYDMMYGKPSDFLDFFAKKGAKTFDGLGMLVQQGALSFELWTQCRLDLTGIDFKRLLTKTAHQSMQ